MTKVLKRIVLPIMLLSSLLLMAISFSGCDEVKEYELLSITDYAYTQGTQTIQITPFEYPPLGGEPVTFKETITKSDIVLLGILSTKTVDNVIFENEQSIKIVISGNAKSFYSYMDTAKIRIKQNGLNGDSNAYGYIEVHKPSAYVHSFAKSGTLAKGYTFQAIIKLTCGEFTDISQVEFLNNVTGSVREKYMAAGALVIEIEGINNDSAVPQIIIREGATSLGKAITLNLADSEFSYIQD